MLSRALAVARKFFPALLLTFFLAWGAWERFRLPMTPCADPDVWVYLAPALSKLSGHGLTHVFGQCFLYPWLLYTMLWCTGDFRWITVTQHLLGLATGALLFGCWMQLRAFVGTPRLPRFAFTCLGAVMVGIYVLATPPIRFERALRPESIFPFFVVLHVWCNLSFVRARFLRQHASRALASGACAVVFSVVACLLKPSFAAALVLGNLPIVLSLFYRGQSWGHKLALIGLPLLITGSLLLLPEWKLRQHDETADLFVSRSLFSIHANLINAQMAEDLAAGARTKYSSIFISAAHEALTESLRESRTPAIGIHWPTLGFNPDYLVYGDDEHTSFVDWIARRLHVTEDQAAFFRYYYQRTLRQHPEWIAAKVWRQLGAFYIFGASPAYRISDDYPLKIEYALSLSCITAKPDLSRYVPGATMIARTNAIKDTGEQIGHQHWVASFATVLAVTYLEGCVWTVFLTVMIAAVPTLRRRYAAASPVFLLLYACNFGTVLTLAFSHTLDVGRYSQYQLAYTLLPQFGSFLLSAELLGFALTREASWTRRLWRQVCRRWSPSPPFVETATWCPPLCLPGMDFVVDKVILAGDRAGIRPTKTSPADHPFDDHEPSAENATAPSVAHDPEVVLLVDPKKGPATSDLQKVVRLYANQPADLTLLCDDRPRSTISLLSAVTLWYAFGWSPRNPWAGGWLCSRRFYRDVLPGIDPSSGLWQVELIIHALDRGYSICEFRTPRSALSDDERARKNHWDRPADGARLLRRLMSLTFRHRPSVALLGIVGIALCIAGISLSGRSWQGFQKRRHHVKLIKVLASPASLLAGLICFHAGLLLGGVRLDRRSRLGKRP